ncbi:MAG: aspartate aminotransferase family protein [Terricaulis sp.]
MRAMASGDVKWRDGKTGMYVFNAGEDVERVKQAAYSMFSEENGLGPAAFPSLARMEREVVGHALALLRAPEGSGGVMTSGGTDSIVMAVKAARDFARAGGMAGQGNLVTPLTAHPAFHKAAMMMDIEIRRVPTKNLLADAEAMEAACDAGTIMLVGSAPCFPFGLIDPLEELSAVALRKNLWLHVDACVGGFLAPFVEMNGAVLSAWDFRVAGVRSISSDLHKYGYCSKGASTLLFRDAAMKQHMVFDAGPWPMGRMLTPTLAGTRPGGAIAAAWAVLNYLGVEGYRAKQKQVVQARESIEAGVKKLGFRVLGEPLLGIVSFTHDSLDCLAILRGLYARGWITAANVDPPSLHMMLSPKHAEVADTYLADLAASMQDASNPAAMPAPGYGR